MDDFRTKNVVARYATTRKCYRTLFRVNKYNNNKLVPT